MDLSNIFIAISAIVINYLLASKAIEDKFKSIESKIRNVEADFNRRENALEHHIFRVEANLYSEKNHSNYTIRLVLGGEENDDV